MAEKNENRFIPDYAIPPGETLVETLEVLGMTQAELADRIGRPRKTINGIIKGKTGITSETALQLERALRVPASFWMNLEAQFQEILSRKEEEQELVDHTDWLERFPIKEMVSRGWISQRENVLDQLKELLTFFGVTSPDRWEEVWGNMPAAFRKSTVFQADPGAVAAWLRVGEIEAQQIPCKPYSAKDFRQALDTIRHLTTEDPSVFIPEMKSLCQSAGVVVLFIKALPKIRAWGATRWLSPDKALIQLTLRYKTDDHLWFSFFHESGHILLHGKRDVFIEDTDEKNGKEEEANNFAANYLIPRDQLEKFILSGAKSKASISRFASELGVSPGIVVGQLQHHKYLPMSHCNDMKLRFEWAD
jgi:addiction module HigA family antidote